MNENIVELINVTKQWPGTKALDTINLEIRKGEILTLLGPSGCGKSTLMRIIAGFDSQTEGTLMLDGRDVRSVPPEKRPVNMVFQRYALFPHLDVFDNVSFALRLKGRKKDEIRDEVNAMLRLVQIEQLGNRWIHEISGGQAQRVALARALINRPQVLLLDEPLAALDLKIRHYMLDELKRIHTETGTTFLYVTHDQDEAMILSDRIALMNSGRIEQVGTPDEMYVRPKSVFAARFFGETNMLEGVVSGTPQALVVDTVEGRFPIGGNAAAPGAKVHVSIRPEAIQIAAGAGGEQGGTIENVQSIGDRIVYRVRGRGGSLLKCQVPRVVTAEHLAVGSEVTLNWQPGAAVVLTA